MVNVFLTTLLYHIREELFYFCNKNVPYLCGLWRFANAYRKENTGGYYEKENTICFCFALSIRYDRL